MQDLVESREAYPPPLLGSMVIYHFRFYFSDPNHSYYSFMIDRLTCVLPSTVRSVIYFNLFIIIICDSLYQISGKMLDPERYILWFFKIIFIYNVLILINNSGLKSRSLTYKNIYATHHLGENPIISLFLAH